MQSSIRVWVLLAPGFEEIEAITALDVLRRAGFVVSAVGLVDSEVRGAHDLTIVADCLLGDLVNDPLPNVIVLPGGMPGATHLRDRPDVQQCLKTSHEQGVLLAALCAAPIALAAAGVLSGRRAVCYPGFESQLTGAVLVDEDVVVDGNVLTSRGVGTALAFALPIVETLHSVELAQELAGKMLVPR